MEIRRGELIEAWRAGSDDLAQPEFAPLAAELERDPALRAECDALHEEQLHFRSALQDAAVPQGLAHRLIQKLGLLPIGEPPAILADVQIAGPAAPAEPEVSATPRSRDATDEKPKAAPFNRVRLLLAMGTLASVFLIAGLSLHWFASPPMRGTELVQSALDLPASESLSGGSWRGDIDAAPIECAFPGRSFRSEVTPLSWRDAEDLVPGTSGVVYRLAASRRAQAYLLVLEVPAGVVGLDVAPKSNASTRGWVACAWRDGNRVCLLLVEGTPDRLRELLRPQSTAA